MDIKTNIIANIDEIFDMLLDDVVQEFHNLDKEIFQLTRMTKKASTLEEKIALIKKKNILESKRYYKRKLRFAYEDLINELYERESNKENKKTT